MKKIAFHTLGCKVNFYETETLKTRFRELGYDIAEETEKADAYVINTCTVTALADRKSRQFIRRMRRLNPNAVIAAVGCYAQVSPEAFEGLREADIVLGTEGKMRLPELLDAMLSEGGERLIDVRPHDKTAAYECGDISVSMAEAGRCRAFIKIEEGCDRFCSYCVIPYARGAVRSRAPEDIVREAESLIAGGFKELVLSGINTALYGSEEAFRERYRGELSSDGAGSGLELILSRLEELKGDFRLRLSSLEPTVVNADYVNRLFRFDRLCRHLHLSAQSGSSRVLRAMRRPYTREEYLEIVRCLRDFDPGYGISTDIIAGFPGEGEEDFEESLSLIREANYVRTHAFNYSRREGTAAAEMEGQLPDRLRAERVRRLIEAGREAAKTFNSAEIGKLHRVLVEEYLEDKELCTGYSGNYMRVYFKSAGELSGRFAHVRITKLYGDGVLGELAPEPERS